MESMLANLPTMYMVGNHEIEDDKTTKMSFLLLIVSVCQALKEVDGPYAIFQICRIIVALGFDI